MTEKSISNKLSELFDLYKSGALTKEEYEQLKGQILSDGGVNTLENVKNSEPEITKSTDKSIQVISQERGDKVENGKTQEPEITKSTDKSISRNKASRIWILAIISIVIIVATFFVFKTSLFQSKSGLTGLNTHAVKDVDGNVYKTVTIGTQVWMAENLKTTKYNDGTTIPLNPDVKAWEELTTPAYCWYDNDETANKDFCGALYNWHAVNTNKLCPTGWHVSTIEEWTTLITYLGGEDIAGGKLKETGTFHWKSPNTGATNETGFTALPGGYLHHLGTFKGNGGFNFWWTASLYDAIHAWNTNVSYNHSKVNRNNYMFQNGLSVRCIQDSNTATDRIPVSNNPIIENKTSDWDEATATKIILKELRTHSWEKIFPDTTKLTQKIVGFTKLSLSNSDVIVAVTLTNDTNSELSGVPSLFEFNNQNGWRLVKNQVGFGEFMENVKLNKIAQDNYCLMTSRSEGGAGQSWEYHQ